MGNISDLFLFNTNYLLFPDVPILGAVSEGDQVLQVRYR